MLGTNLATRSSWSAIVILCVGIIVMIKKVFNIVKCYRFDCDIVLGNEEDAEMHFEATLLVAPKAVL